MEEMTKIDYPVQQNTNKNMRPLRNQKKNERSEKRQQNDEENDNKIQ